MICLYERLGSSSVAVAIAHQVHMHLVLHHQYVLATTLPFAWHQKVHAAAAAAEEKFRNMNASCKFMTQLQQ